ncbi:MAG: YceI family protein [Bacteroidia bacterium]
MKKIVLVLGFALLMIQLKAQVFSTSTGKVSFFSATPVEDIKAMDSHVLAVLNTKGELAVLITNTQFEFENKLMQEHFNEKYIESEKYPQSSFKGKINEPIDFTKDGEHNVTVTGKLNIHGVEQDRTIVGKLIIKNGTVQLISDFKVKNADHKIEIPKLVVAKIAESIDVKVDCLLLPKK